MGSLVNQKGAFFRTLEITRDSSSKNETILIEPIIKKAENYICQVQRFITNATPDIFQKTDWFIRVLRKPQTSVDNLSTEITFQGQMQIAPYSEFIPGSCKCVTEFVRVLYEWVALHTGLSVNLNIDNTISFTLSREFGSLYYLEFSPYVQNRLNFRQYICFDYHFDELITYPVFEERNDFFWRALEIDLLDQTADDTEYLPINNVAFELFKLEYNDYYPENVISSLIRQFGYNPEGDDSRVFISGNTIDNIDSLFSLDIYMSLPHRPINEILDEKESLHKLIARFPYKDYKVFESKLSFDNSHSIRESVNLGLENLTRNTPDSNTTLLLPGDIQHANVRLFSRYLRSVEGKNVFSRVPSNLGLFGFWSLKLIFAKKMK